MVSQNKYYERKNAGLCTKCGDPLDSDKSTTRCSKCYEKFLNSAKKTRNQRLQEQCCLGCGIKKSLDNSNYCNACRQKNAENKRQNSQPIIRYNNENRFCKVCNNPINTDGSLCSTCLSNIQFSKIDAIARYESKCFFCGNTDVESLRIISNDITKSMEKYGPDLYKTICFSTTAPKEYKCACHQCYWKENLNYIKELKNFFENKNPSEDDNIIDIDNFEVNE